MKIFNGFFFFQKIQSNDVSKLFSPFCLAFIFALPKDRTIKGKVTQSKVNSWRIGRIFLVYKTIENSF